MFFEYRSYTEQIMESTEPLMGYRWFDPKIYLLNKSKEGCKVDITVEANSVERKEDSIKTAHSDDDLILKFDQMKK